MLKKMLKGTFLLLVIATRMSAQTPVQNRADLEKERASIQKEIEDVKRSLEETHKNKRETLGQLNLLQRGWKKSSRPSSGPRLHPWAPNPWSILHARQTK